MPVGEGGGPNPPYGEDFFQRIVGVHWPKKTPGVPQGGVFVAGDNNTNIYCIQFGLEGKTPAWVNLGQLDFAAANAGFVQGSSYALIGKDPAFVLVGGGGGVNEIGLILASQDGLNWEKVFTLNFVAGTSSGANIFGVVWDDGAQSFFAGGHIFSDFFEGADTGAFFKTKIDLLLASPDGFSWREVDRHETRLTYADGFPPFPDYPRGLLAPHCSGMVVDSYGNGLPDGFYKYDPGSKSMIAPTALPKIDYSEGLVRLPFSGAGVDVTNFGAGTVLPSDVGIPTLCVAGAGGAWVAAGGNYDPGTSTCQASYMFPSIDQTGLGWKPLDPPGSTAIITITGGTAKAPPA